MGTGNRPAHSAGNARDCGISAVRFQRRGARMSAMALTFYYGSGSPFAWKVWLALEHKGIAYDFKLLSFDRGDHRTPEYLAINPRGKVPAIVDDGFALWESGAILEYLEERYPEPPLLPQDLQGRATVRRLAAEAEGHFSALQRRLFELAFGKSPASEDDIAAVKSAWAAELQRWEVYLGDREHLAGALSLADFVAYPYIRSLLRADERRPEFAVSEVIPPGVRGWMSRIAALPYHDRTLPPHWRG